MVQVIVTVESLCELTHEYSSKPGVAAALCEKLEDGAFQAYRRQLNAQIGRTLTAAEEQ